MTNVVESLSYTFVWIFLFLVSRIFPFRDESETFIPYSLRIISSLVSTKRWFLQHILALGHMKLLDLSVKRILFIPDGAYLLVVMSPIGICPIRRGVLSWIQMVIPDLNCKINDWVHVRFKITIYNYYLYQTLVPNTTRKWRKIATLFSRSK